MTLFQPLPQTQSITIMSSTPCELWLLRTPRVLTWGSCSGFWCLCWHGGKQLVAEPGRKVCWRRRPRVEMTDACWVGRRSCHHHTCQSGRSSYWRRLIGSPCLHQWPEEEAEQWFLRIQYLILVLKGATFMWGRHAALMSSTVRLDRAKPTKNVLSGRRPSLNNHLNKSTMQKTLAKGQTPHSTNFKHTTLSLLQLVCATHHKVG